MPETPFHSELEFENKRLEQTISLAKKQLKQAVLDNENNKEAILEARREMRENAAHSPSGLGTSEGFEDLVALSQYVNPIIDKLAEYEETGNRIIRLENLIDSPYFARIDFKFDDEDIFEKIYIGRSSLRADKSNEMYVYDWRSPIASIFYRFAAGPVFYEAPVGRITGEVNLKRQYQIKGGILEYFFDADVQIIDEFLRKLLSQSTSSKMKTIVETIQKEQDIVIRDMENELMMVQGVAGSGKTAIALHRAAYLMYQGLSSKLASHNIVIISPNVLFKQYISNVLPELGEDNVLSVVFEEMLKTILKNSRIQTRNQFLEILITNSRYQNIMKSSIEFKTSLQFSEVLNRFIDDLPHRWIVFDDIYYGNQRIASKEVLKSKILSGKKDIPLGQRLKQLEDFILESAKKLHKQHANKSEYFRIKKEVQKFTELNVESLYKELFSDEKYFYSLVNDLELPDCIEDILKFTQENLDSKTLYYDDAIVLAFLKLKLNRFNEYKDIRHVVIDEAQDYYPLHYEIVNLLFSNSKYTVLGDINQALEKQADLSLYDQIGKILNKKKATLVKMDKSFRCTNEILAFSSRFISQSLEIKSFNRKGYEPKIHIAADRPSLCDMIISEVNFCLKEGYQSIGLICKTEKNAVSLFAYLRDSLDVQVIKNENTADLQGIFIIPVYMSKGLEFDAVLICDTDNENYKSEEDKKLLYIACTRALHRLNLFCQGDVSPLV